MALQKFNLLGTNKLNDLMNMPPVALCYIDKSCPDMYYPKPLIKQWKECTQGICAENSDVNSGKKLQIQLLLPYCSRFKVK